jgi:Ceramidase
MWSTPVDLYCERTDPSFWAEPVNALSNAAFLIAAAFAYRDRRRAGSHDIATLLLIAVTVLVGLGSFAFHTLATRGAALLDVIPIAVFIHGYLYVAIRRFIGLGCLASLAIVVAFFAFREGLAAILPRGLLNGSAGYLPALAAMLVVGGLVRSTPAGRMLLWAAVVFAVSLTFRTIDLAVCAGLPLGTHALWHGLNAVVLYLLVRAAIDAGPVSAREEPR